MTALPYISFLVLTYNQAPYIYDAIMSGLEQDWQGNMEIIVQDDASTDHTEQEVLRAIAANPHPDRFVVHYHKNDHNLGLGGNMRDGLSRCQGDIIVYNDGDDISFPQRVRYVAEIFAAHPDVLLVSGEIYWLCNNERHKPRYNFAPSPSLRSLHDSLKSKMRHEMWGCTPSYRRSLITDFPPMLPTTPTSDTWIQWRAFEMGNGKKSVFHDNRAHVYYRIHDSQLTGAKNMHQMRRTHIFRQYWSDYCYAVKHYLSIYLSIAILPFLLHYGIAALLQYNPLWRAFRRRFKKKED